MGLMGLGGLISVIGGLFSWWLFINLFVGPISGYSFSLKTA
jgi:hypothetical protein